MAEAVRHAITDPSSAQLANVRESSTPGTYGLVVVNPDGSTISGGGGSATLISNVDTADATYFYFGDAAPGSANSAAAWRVSRMTKAAPYLLRYAAGGAFSQVWDDRAGLSYA